MNLLTATDNKLTQLRQELDNEIRRRTLVATDGCDALAIIYGNELAKRALVVAAAGGHSLLLIGPPNCGKTMIRAVALQLGLADTYEARPCPCGHRCNPNVDCRCTVKQIERHIGKIPVAEITVEMMEPTPRETGVVGTTLGDMQRQIANKTDHTCCELDSTCRQLLNATIREMNIDMVVQRQIVNVARTIANLDQSAKIEPAHLMEAINYRPLWRNV
jgi:predicted ATPase with chaperone activity